MTREQLHQERVKRGWSFRRAAEELGVSYPYLCNVEGGRKPLKEWLVERAMDVYWNGAKVGPPPAMYYEPELEDEGVIILW